MAAFRFLVTVVPVSFCMLVGTALEVVGDWLLVRGLRMIDWSEGK